MLSLTSITNAATPDYLRAWQLYEEAFPPEERRTAAQQLELLSNPNYSFRIISAEDEFCGLMGVWHLPGFMFLEHLAILSSKRGEGIGSVALELLLKVGLQPIVLEVEPPVDELTRKRVAFYTKVGFVLNAFEYLQPPYSSEKPWVPLQLMSYPEPLSAETFEWAQAQLYRLVYGQ